jgi:hypothetical protein
MIDKKELEKEAEKWSLFKSVKKPKQQIDVITNKVNEGFVAGAEYAILKSKKYFFEFIDWSLKNGWHKQVNYNFWEKNGEKLNTTEELFNKFLEYKQKK